ncbi:T9SS type A sorting domain-containing protein, partial [Fulvivirga kasyanovii]
KIVIVMRNPHSDRMHNIVRLDAHGELDGSFSPLYNVFEGEILDVVIQPDNKILIGGDFNLYENAPRVITRINPDGSLDNSFNATAVGIAASVEDVHLHYIDGEYKILVAGSIYSQDGSNYVLFRLNSDGTIDTKFKALPYDYTNVYAVGTLGKDTYLQYNRKLIKLDEAGNIYDLGVRVDYYVKEILFTKDNEMILGGSFSDVNGEKDAIAKLSPSGDVDQSFDVDFDGRAEINDIIELTGGSLMVVGNQSHINEIEVQQLAKINLQGVPDETFNPDLGNILKIYQAKISPDNTKIVVAGNFNNEFDIRRLRMDGSADPTFNANMEVLPSEPKIEMYFLDDGRLIIFMQYYSNGPITESVMLLPDGSVDGSFTPLYLDGYLRGVNHLTNGNFVIGYSSAVDNKTVFKIITPEGQHVAEYIQNSNRINRFVVASDEIYFFQDNVFYKINLSNAEVEQLSLVLKSIWSAPVHSFSYQQDKFFMTGDFVRAEDGIEKIAVLDKDFNLLKGYFWNVVVANWGDIKSGGYVKVLETGQILTYGELISVNDEPRTGLALLDIPINEPAIPSEVSLTKREGSIYELGWQDNSNNETGFEVQRIIYKEGEEVGAVTITITGKNTTSIELDESSKYVQYKVSAVNAVGSSKFAISNLISPPITALEARMESSVKVYPNPGNGLIYITGHKKGTIEQMIIRDSRGTKLKEFNGFLETIDIRNYPEGIYFLEVIIGQRVGHVRFVKID